MVKYSLDFKIEAVTACLHGPDGYRRVASRYGVPTTLFRHWVAAYKTHGAAGLAKPFMIYPLEIRYQVVQSVLTDGLSINEAVAKHNILSRGTVQNWIRLYNEGGIEALKRKYRGRSEMSKHSKIAVVPDKPLEEMTREELLKELEYRRAEVAYLKKLDALIQSKKSAAKNKRG